MFLPAALTSCSSSTAPTENTALATMVVEAADCRTESEYTARLAGRQVVEVRAEVEGLITRICFEEGQRVRRGQLLFVIDQEPYKARLAQAEAAVRVAQAELAAAQLKQEGTTRLHEGGVVDNYDVRMTKAGLLAAEGALAQAEAARKTARVSLDKTEVRSPTDGVTGMIGFRVGALVGPGTQEPLTIVADNRVMYAYFSLAESHVQDMLDRFGCMDSCLKGLEDVELRLSNGHAYGGKGRVTAVSGMVSEGTGSVTLRADFPNEEGRLISGGSATVVLPTLRRGCLTVPQGATFELQERTFVYRVQQGKTCMTSVRVTPLSNEQQFIVEEGLQAGDTIVAEGAGLVKDGMEVNGKDKKEK